MTNIENYISLVRRNGYSHMPVFFNPCPSVKKAFSEYVKETGLEYTITAESLPEFECIMETPEYFRRFYDCSFKPGTVIDKWGVAHEPGSEAAFHMTKMHHPMKNFDSVEQIMSYPLPDFRHANIDKMRKAVDNIHKQDKIAKAEMACTVWEIAWYMRSMEELMTDMMMDDPMAEVLLDRVTENAVNRAENYARCGADVILLGDDVGMQRTIMMSEELYCTWLKPRLTKVIRAAKAIKPDILIMYHSCGFVTPLIPHLIEAGIDILDPVQPECMDFREIHEMYGDRLSFHGTIGTQTTMPFGTPEDVHREVFRNLEIAGNKGGLLVAPTHMLEPEVPVENVAAYIQACKDFTK